MKYAIQKRYLFIALTFLFVSPFLATQTKNAHLTIEVTDHSGAVVPGAQVKLNPAHTASDDLQTREDGRLSLMLPQGPYELSVIARGFKPLSQKIQVNDSANTIIRVVLEVEPSPQTVYVGGHDLIPVDPTSAWFSQVDNTLLPTYSLTHLLKTIETCCAPHVAPPGRTPGNPGHATQKLKQKWKRQ